ncbi:BTB/POZ and TAZ domain-containing protein 4-like [Olea europaea var. sylvestris]|uniref:BTB/POZ and TAZ domain-containing protein 4-like n=1 Tax=Olea europaea var. sylvestris TaxID=158386 RepID=UPI000C1CFBEF|nr:BTB/POZ and TAZ domain-containing protein 4-like [Olea europaea var. sylvestris]XP_022885992.1 BTB/POZ and TAZ domain-containing protein 4-like [Olea europaea var. sylvestris]
MAFPLPPPLPTQKGFTPTKSKIKSCFSASITMNHSLDCLFDEGYRADVSILMDYDNVIYAHASILGAASPVLKGMLKQSRGHRRNRKQAISIRGVPPEAVRVFIRFLYSSCYEEEKIEEFALPLLVLSHVYVVPRLKRLCELWLEQELMNTENVIDIFQLALLCDAPRLSFICHRFILRNFKPVSASEGWKIMKKSHPKLEKEIIESVIYEDVAKKERSRKINERKTYLQLYEAMEALVHICRDGCRTIGPHDKILRDDQAPCKYEACKGLEMLIRHFAQCKLRGPGGCIHCKRMWQILELHSRLCADSDLCKVPLCRNFRQRRRKQNKKEDIRWRILVRKIVRSRSIAGAPFFSLEC